MTLSDPRLAPRRGAQYLRRGQLYALAAMAIWSTNFIIGRALRDELTPGTMAAFRALIAGVPMGLWMLRRHGLPRDAGRLLGPLTAVGLLGIVACQYMTYLSLHWTLATNVIILNAASPLVTATIAVLVGTAPFAPGLFRGLLLSVAGAGLVTAFGTGGAARLQADTGALLVLATMVVWAFYNLGVQRLSRSLSTLVVTSSAMLIGFPFLVAIVALEHPPHLWTSIRTHLPILVYLAIGPSAIGYFCWNAAVRDLGPDYAMMFNNLLPVFGMVLGGLVLRESVTAVQIGASALIIGGILVAFRSLTASARAQTRS